MPAPFRGAPLCPPPPTPTPAPANHCSRPSSSPGKLASAHCQERFPLRAAVLKLAKTRHGGEGAFGEVADGVTESEDASLLLPAHSLASPPAGQ